MTTGQACRRAIEYLVEVFGRDTTLFLVTIFLLVCDKEGITMHEIGQELDMFSATVSSNIKRLSKYRTEKGVQGYDLVYTRQDMVERRRFAVYLTDRGREVRDTFYNLVSSEQS